MSDSLITLYDIPSTIPQPWAPNIWRVRFVLNYKRLRYQTLWVELADVEATLRAINAPPTSYNSDRRSVYTLPVIVDFTRSKTSPVVLSNADNIVEYLERTYPARPIFPEGSRALQTLFVQHIQKRFVKPLLPILVPLSHARLRERSQAPVSPTPTELVGTQREQAWRAVKEEFDFLAWILEKNAAPDGDGIVVMGRNVSYADFALCSVLIWIERVSPHDGWVRIRQWNNGRWMRLWERCRDCMDVF
ncbi:hypothetical protein CERSUDRAFT_84368 [Gelatoporia subvermispora B]|uniref:Uncharacterized protein n=1 Tax=Ceriporiopsis subvermispora (strain B) TaxID=914234 RepID=M2PJA9_CERS8|nr:hypothetical protein CERSUDRAFT_84368 [Gelatoporia subvermispora B]